MVGRRWLRTGSCFAPARIAAALPNSPVVVPMGEEARFLAPEIDISGTLARWGLRSIGDLAKLPAGEIAGAVRAASGPWTLEEGWWSDSRAARAYWDVELEGGGLYRLYRDVKNGDWFADGVYD